MLYIVGEGAGSGITRRFKAWSISNNVDLKGAHIIVREASTILPEHTDQLTKEVEEFLKERGWNLELVILDTLSRTMQGDENSQKDFNEYQHALDTIRDKFQCAVMFLHHIGHGDKTRARGASAIRCNVDVELSMELVGDKVSKLHAWKVKDSSASDDMCFQLTVVDLGCFDGGGDPITSVVLRHLEGYMPAKSEKLGKNEDAAITILNKHGGSMLAGDLRKAIREHVKAQATKRGEHEPKYATLKIASSRALTSLLGKNLVIESDDGKTVSLPSGKGIHGIHNGIHVPMLPGTDGIHGIHHPIGCIPITSTVYTNPLTEERIHKDTVLVKESSKEESSDRGTSEGTKVTKPNVYLDAPPDLGTNDEGYWDALLKDGN